VGSPTFFDQNAQSSQSNASDYLKDTFDDYTLDATNNGTLTDTALTNPLRANFANTDIPLYGVKTLWIKDIQLISDKSKWISGKPTYQVQWNENFPNVVGYFAGNVALDVVPSLKQGLVSATQILEPRTVAERRQVNFGSTGDVFGVTGKIRKVQYILKKLVSGAVLTPQCQIDGVNSNTVSLGPLPVNIGFFEDTASLQTNDLHTYSIASPDPGSVSVVGIVVYFENSGANFEALPGSSYVDKSKVTTTSGVTFAVGSSIGSSLGSIFTIYKSGSGYNQDYQNLPAITSVGNGFSGTNLLTVSTGTGASFPLNTAIMAQQGASTFLSNIINQSGDVLTLGVTIPFGISTSIIRSWNYGPSFPVSATLMQLIEMIDFKNNLNVGGTNLPGNVFPGVLNYSSPYLNYHISALNLGTSNVVTNIPSAVWNGLSGVIQIEGYFQGLNIETVGNAQLNMTSYVNGITATVYAESQTGIINRTIMSNAPVQWNSVVLACGASQGLVGIKSISLYKYHSAPGISFGKLSRTDFLESFGSRPAYNATLAPMGTFRRVRAAELNYSFGASGWTRQVGMSNVFGFEQYSISATGVVGYQYYGNRFMVQGTLGSSTTYSVNGAGASPLALGIPLGVTTEGFYRVDITNWSGSFAISGFEYGRSKDELINLRQTKSQNVAKDNISSLNIFNINMNNYPFLSVYQGATGILTHNAITKFFYVNKTVDDLNLYNPASGLFSAPRNCRLLFMASLFTADLNYGDIRLSVSRNNSGAEDLVLFRRFSSTNSNGIQNIFGFGSFGAATAGSLDANIKAQEIFNFNVVQTNTSTTAMLIDTSTTVNGFMIMSIDNLPFNPNTLGRFF